mmetsp:Transcript_14745/g.16893  ORF Transcript_14745/g.16893 Transcript_14745/m.16893 type:complete len:295 (+) Transcript_14745:92-976(+)|eukprot:CAMPEP_0194146684 /NCGR_PEP_ID=MMETSP0152-20130528/21315_1 /TAXON_ID=1049557 /ORGANISM="Thalassiothrix antarctica, Strain L6-D1" /LENGTH=294 /DNA_ID=CAMNT_0038847261 /DNA_START=76 /DNA_END=960 /DNA_ORIENTATION=-
MIPPQRNHLAMLGLLVSSACLTTANSQTVTVEKKNKLQYDQAINIKFDYPQDYAPKDRDWVGIFEDTNPSLPLTTYPESDGNLSFYLRICNQSDAPCPALPLPTTGTLQFYVKDPSAAYEKQWPIPIGEYRACLVDDGGSGNEYTGNYQVVGSCMKFSVKKSRKSRKMVSKSRVKVLKSTYNYEETISASFKNARMITNAWVGIYDYDADLKKGDPGVDDPLMWVYTGCNNVMGDQNTNNNCAVKKKHGQVDFKEDNTYGWPLPEGKYMVMISFDNNSPHGNIKFNRTEFRITA